ncbi:unnamed protein product (macronuclear) [Paramecium tetraurelia]|uniref:Cyclic nucleotide-binding domain-containing protein n=1 Tax=Paramecium tetraurelia TaxID=5888 RepID=A0DCE8_PARTE|nr:uncharacterized protein GSPATT00015593001 [Paramecium tetraurelia]CAK80715.1 unnamed protein product [Paramecium tetraurelia]|eukprot:XP_001448112.1 hypothetical protein (macronuclear) [Paramecium tetraurelia strain d4-2]
MIQDEIKNEFLILSPSQSYDGSIMYLQFLSLRINNNQKENSFQVGKRINMSHPRQPSYEVEEDKTPAFEIFDLKANKQTKGITWQFRNQGEQTIVKNNITQANTFQQNQKKVLAFINKLKQHLTLKNKQHKFINQLLFSPLNAGKKIYKNSLQPQLNLIWDSIIFFFCILILIISPVEYIYQTNGYGNYLFTSLIILTILDQIYKYTSQICQEEYLYQSKQFLEYIFKSSKILMDTSSIVLLTMLILSDNEFIKTISLLIIELITYKKIFLAFNKRLYYEMSDLTIQIVQILHTCHYFTYDQVKGSQDMFQEYLQIYVNYIIQLEISNWNMCTTFILLFYKILIIKLIILDSLEFYQEFKKIKELKLLQRFLYKQKISQTLKYQISRKLEEVCLKDQNFQNIENYFEQCLEKEQLFQEFKEQQLLNFVKQFRIFSQFSKSTQQQIAQNLTPIILNINDKFRCNHYGDQYNIYLVNQGKVAYGLTESIPEYKKIFSGQCFGQYSFFTGQENQNLITGLGYCILYKLSREKFLKIISSNIQDLEIAAFIKDQILFNNNYQIIDSVCQYCQDRTHLLINCPQIHLIKNNIGFYDKYLYSPNQPRKSFDRGRKRNQNCFLNHFKQINAIHLNEAEIEEVSSEFSQQSSSVIESNQEKNELQLQGESQNNLLIEINNENIKQNEQQQQLEYCQQNSAQQLQQKSLSRNIFDLKISKILNQPLSLNILPSLQSNTSPIFNLKTTSLPTATEFLNFISDYPCMEEIYKINLDRMQDFETYYPEYNIGMVLFRMKRNMKLNNEQKSKFTINQSAALTISKIIKRKDQPTKI